MKTGSSAAAFAAAIYDRTTRTQSFTPVMLSSGTPNAGGGTKARA